MCEKIGILPTHSATRSEKQAPGVRGAALPSPGQPERPIMDLSGAPWPVWRGSVEFDVPFKPITKKQRDRIWFKARKLERKTKKGNGCHGGAIGPAAMDVLEALLFDFLNLSSGRLDPSYNAIAKASCKCRKTVADALQRLRDVGVLGWIRRCQTVRRDDGTYERRQKTNAYFLHEPDVEEAPKPMPGTWGDPPKMPSVIEQAAQECRAGAPPKEVIRLLELEAGNRLALALASLGRAIQG
jgi:hypothetical protein